MAALTARLDLRQEERLASRNGPPLRTAIRRARCRPARNDRRVA